MLFSKEAKLDTNLGPPISCVSFLATCTYYHIYPLQKQPPLVFFSFQSAMLLVYTVWKLWNFTFIRKKIRGKSLKCNLVLITLISRNFCNKKLEKIYAIYTLWYMSRGGASSVKGGKHENR